MATAVNTLFNGTVTSSGDSGIQGAPTNQVIGVFVSVSAVSGVLSSLSLKLQHSPDGGTTWFNVPLSGGLFQLTGINSTGDYSLYATTSQLIMTDVKLVWTVSGTNPSFTFICTIATAS